MCLPHIEGYTVRCNDPLNLKMKSLPDDLYGLDYRERRVDDELRTSATSLPSTRVGYRSQPISIWTNLGIMDDFTPTRMKHRDQFSQPEDW